MKEFSFTHPELEGLSIYKEKNTALSSHCVYSRAKKPGVEPKFVPASPNTELGEGFVCANTEELLIAYRLLDSLDLELIANAIPFSKPGLPIHTIEELKLFDFPDGSVVLRKVPQSAADEKNLLVVSAGSFAADEIVVLEKIMIGSTLMGPIRC